MLVVEIEGLSIGSETASACQYYCLCIHHRPYHDQESDSRDGDDVGNGVVQLTSRSAQARLAGQRDSEIVLSKQYGT